ncbi:MAG TPA: heme-degrading domain-containing protein [Burkholderiales bacterium]|nr:heme-degrading domain-containing protein [Burkholderiales bacterium]
MAADTELKTIAQQEEQLQFERFDAATAFEIGTRIKTIAERRGVAVAIDVQLNGWPLFFYAMPGTTPNNADWIRRKRNTVLRFHKSSHRVDLELQQKKTTLAERQGLSTADYVAAGGGFPVILRGTGCVGAITVSGLSREEDHELIVEAITGFLGG